MSDLFDGVPLDDRQKSFLERYVPSEKELKVASRFLDAAKVKFPDRRMVHSIEDYAKIMAHMMEISETKFNLEQLISALLYGLEKERYWGSKLISMKRFKYYTRNTSGELLVDGLFESFYESTRQSSDGFMCIEEMTDSQIYEHVFDSEGSPQICISFRMIRNCFLHTEKLTKERISCLVAITETLYYTCSNHTTFVNTDRGTLSIRGTFGRLDSIYDFESILKEKPRAILDFYPGSKLWNEIIINRILMNRLSYQKYYNGYLIDYEKTPLIDVYHQYKNTNLFDWVS